MTMPFQFPKPTQWDVHSNFVCQVYNHNNKLFTQYDFSDHKNAFEAHAMCNITFEQAALWQIIREPGQETRVVFRSYIPSIHVDWKE